MAAQETLLAPSTASLANANFQVQRGGPWKGWSAGPVGLALSDLVDGRQANYRFLKREIASAYHGMFVFEACSSRCGQHGSAKTNSMVSDVLKVLPTCPVETLKRIKEVDPLSEVQRIGQRTYTGDTIVAKVTLACEGGGATGLRSGVIRSKIAGQGPFTIACRSAAAVETGVSKDELVPQASFEVGRSVQWKERGATGANCVR